MSEFQRYLDENLGTVQMTSRNSDLDSMGSYDIYQEIREAIISLRHDNHLTQKGLAVRTGLTQANISNFEKGISKPTIDSLKKIADATGTRLIVEFVDQEIE